ncbi:MAG: hypothetical protein HUU10_04560 [Bacteroidetes bacterium]|nr:hypothetical protein [Bacteroidota bacterium]
MRPTGVTSGAIVYEAPTLEISGGILYIRTANLLLETAEELWKQVKVRPVSGAASMAKWIAGLIMDQNAKLDVSGLATGTHTVFVEHAVNYLYPFPATFQNGTANVNFTGGDLTRVYEAGMRIMYGGTAYQIQSVDSGNNRLVLTAVHGLNLSGVYVEIGGEFSPSGPQPTLSTHYRFVEMDGLTITTSAGSVSPTGRKIKVGEITKDGGGVWTIDVTPSKLTVAQSAMAHNFDTYLSGILTGAHTDKGGKKIQNLGSGTASGDAVNKGQLDGKLSKTGVDTVTDNRENEGGDPVALYTLNHTGSDTYHPFFDFLLDGVLKARINADGTIKIPSPTEDDHAATYGLVKGKVSLNTEETISALKLFAQGIKFAADGLALDSYFQSSSFIPTVEGEGGSGTTMNYSSRVCSYIRIGKIVIAAFNIEWDETTTTWSAGIKLSFPENISTAGIILGDLYLQPAGAGTYVPVRAVRHANNVVLLLKQSDGLSAYVTDYQKIQGTVLFMIQ